MTLASGDFSDIYRREAGRCIATLVRVLGDIDEAEDAVADAFAIAAERWADDGIPPNPGGWIMTTARNRAIDRHRRESKRSERHRQAHDLQEGEPTVTPDLGDLELVEDDQLRLIFLCCHPALAPDAQVALTLRLLGGLETPEIARAFLIPEGTVAQRIVRAKRKIRDNHVTYRVPTSQDLPGRLPSVLATVYLMFNEGHTASSGLELIRPELTTPAIRLGRLLAEMLPDEPEAAGLLALMLLTEARRDARIGADGSLVRLADQDRTIWDRALISEGHELVRDCLRRDEPGPYQIQAAIAAVHADAATADATDWSQIAALYDHLLAVQPDEVVALNRAVAIAQHEGPEAGLEALEEVDLDNYHLYHATRAEFLSSLGQRKAALDALDRAIALTTNETEHRHLAEQRAEISAGSGNVD